MRTFPRPQACGIKNVNISVAKSGPEDVLKKDPAAEKAPDAGAVDSDKAKAMFAAHAPHPTAVFWSKFERPAAGAIKGALKKDIPAAKTGAEASVDETGVIKNDPALKPVIKIDTALKQAAICGETLPSIKEFPEEEPAPAASASQHHPVHTLWSTTVYVTRRASTSGLSSRRRPAARCSRRSRSFRSPPWRRAPCFCAVRLPTTP